MALDWVQGCVARICLGVCSVECCPVHCVLPAIASSESVSKVHVLRGLSLGAYRGQCTTCRRCPSCLWQAHVCLRSILCKGVEQAFGF